MSQLHYFSNFIDSVQFFVPIQENISKFYSTTSQLIGIVLILWCINLLIGLIQRTYSTGKALGRFYHSYLHKYIRSMSFTLINFIFKSRNESKQTQVG